MLKSSLSHYEDPCPWEGSASDPHILLDNMVETSEHYWVYESETEIRLLGVVDYEDSNPLLATLAVGRVGGQRIYNVRTPKHSGVGCFLSLPLAKHWAEVSARNMR